MRKMITLLATVFAAFSSPYFIGCNDAPSAPHEDHSADSLQKMVARGQYLALHVAACIHCHSKRDFGKYAGPVVPGTEGGGGNKFSNSEVEDIPGTVYSRNITPDPETGIGTWTDEEIILAITQGISKNGDTLFPIMPYANYNRMAKDDLLSIIAYIRTLKPVKNKVPSRELMIPVSMAYPGPVLQQSIDGNMRPPDTDQLKYGEYLVTMADCAGCHTPFVKGEPDFSRAFAGSNTFTMDGFTVTSANITPDSTTGIGAWNEEVFIKKFSACREEKGYNYDPGKMNTIMPIVDYSGMTDSDLKAIFAYLRSTKPVKNLVMKFPK
ncbi:MAG TPA: cytochrome c [Agriterribacter sp.]|nr:cytochrome c [Agriterribacter sp.]